VNCADLVALRGATFALVVVIVGCVAASPTPTLAPVGSGVTTSSPSLYPLVLGRERCNPSSPRIPSAGVAFGALVGTATPGHAIHALMEPLVYAGDEAKIVWRMTGMGPLVIYAIHEDGTRIEPTKVEAHTAGSSFAFPGDEWGVFIRFSKPGCWSVQAERDPARGAIWFIASVRPN
jgi:hypothetical protein